MTTPQQNPRRALGKGLSALLPTQLPSAVAPAVAPAPAKTPAGPEHANRIAIEQIDPNPVQPRRVFQADSLHQLADSIRLHGIIQPLVVRVSGERFQLVAGERRWRAARIAGLSEVPAVVQEISDERLLEVTLIENVQREDLNAIDRARAFDRLQKEFKLNNTDIAKKVGKSREYVSNSVRLLALPTEILDALSQGKISEGHARPLMMLGDRLEEQMTLFKEIMFRKLTVRFVAPKRTIVRVEGSG